MVRKIVLDNNIVVNFIEIEDGEPYPNPLLPDSPGIQIGDLWDGSTFTTPAPLPPTTKEVRATRLQALVAQKVWDSVETKEVLDSILEIMGFSVEL